MNGKPFKFQFSAPLFENADGLLDTFILILCGQPTTDVTFLLVLIQYLPDLQIQASAVFRKPQLKVFMNSGLRYSKVACCGADGCSVFDDVHSQFAGPILNGVCHSYPSDAVFCQQNLCKKDTGHDKYKDFINNDLRTGFFAAVQL